MTAARPQNKAAIPPPPPLSPLACEMTETLVGFAAYVRFENVDPAENRHRFSDLTWQPTLFGEAALVRTWGRQVQAGTTRATFYPDRACAEAEVRAVVRRRLAHGYHVIAWQ